MTGIEINMTRYVFITGGVVSSLGKGIASAALGSILQKRGFKVRLRKLDPYLNVDPGTMSPYQHGEVFVTDDGAETDLDLGHYERFTDISANQNDNITAGRIYQNIIERERRGDYLGATIQVIPHVTNAIKEFILSGDSDNDFVICEVGGTIGDIEGLPFFEALRQLGQHLTRSNAIFIHVTLLPYIESAGEIKTKPTQHSVKELRSIGVQPDILLCRCDRKIPAEEQKKLALFCNVSENSVIPALNSDSIYSVPIDYHKAGFDRIVLEHFNMSDSPLPDLDDWYHIQQILTRLDGKVTIGIVGKYISLLDAYKSLIEALQHGGIANKVQIDIKWINSEALEGDGSEHLLYNLDAVLVPGGFGHRGFEGKIRAAQYARIHRIPFLGICLGMQMAVIETARNLAGLTNANTAEFDKKDILPIIDLMTEWKTKNSVVKRNKEGDLGGTMRLGSYQSCLKKDSLVYQIYKKEEIFERHRHRYEVDIKYKDVLEENGMRVSACSPDGKLPEIIERVDHPWFLGVQFHPELKSRPFKCHPIFASFIQAAIKQNRLV